MKKTNVVILFGSRSVEHEVSIVTALEVMSRIDLKKYNIIPVYIDKEGRWWSGEGLRDINSYKNLSLISKSGLVEYKLTGIVGEKKLVSVNKLIKKIIDFDILFLILHGTYGEDGTIQGMLEMLKIPYTGCGVVASALGMDKVLQKYVFRDVGIPVVDFHWFYSKEYLENKSKIIKEVEAKLGYPVFVKPANLGSSVGINVAKNRRNLVHAIEVAKEFDRKIIVEKGLLGIDEINCSVMGDEDKIKVSVCEQPVKNKSILSYEDKYMNGGKTKGMESLTRLLPAPIKRDLSDKIQEYALKSFKTIGASGVARIDFLVDIKNEKLYLNEINTLPGALSFYLWEASGFKSSEFLDLLICLGFERFEKRNRINFSFDSGLFSGKVKGSKI